MEDAIASAIGNSPAAPGAVALTHRRPFRRARCRWRRRQRDGGYGRPGRRGPVAVVARPAAPQPEAQSAEAAIAEQRRQDAANCRPRPRRAPGHKPQPTARPPGRGSARAQAEARARAQAQAEAQAAASRNQQYRPPEVDSEPEVMAAVPQNAIGNAAASATVKDGIQLSSTQIIGTIGAGRACRALVACPTTVAC